MASSTRWSSRARAGRDLRYRRSLEGVHGRARRRVRHRCPGPARASSLRTSKSFQASSGTCLSRTPRSRRSRGTWELLGKDRGVRQVSSGRAVFLDRDGVINRSSSIRTQAISANAAARVEDVGLPLGRRGDRGAALCGSRRSRSPSSPTNPPQPRERTRETSSLRCTTTSTTTCATPVPRSTCGDTACTTPKAPSEARAGLRCRKPAPGLLIDGAAAFDVSDLAPSWMVGDSDIDVEAGRAAGCRTILVEHPDSASPEGRARAGSPCG